MGNDAPRFLLPETIADDDVLLQIWSSRDEDAVRTAVRVSEEEFRGWLPGVSAETRDASAFLAAARELFAAGTAFLYAIARDGEIVGQCSLNRHEDDQGIIGYWVRTDRTGEGTATAALRLLTATAFAHGYERLELRCDEGNARSASVARKAGYEHVATVPVPGERTALQTGREMIWEQVAVGP